MCTTVCLLVCANKHRGPWLTLGAFLDHPSPPKHTLSLAELANAVILLGSLLQGFPLCLLSTEVTGRLHGYAVFMRVLRI